MRTLILVSCCGDKLPHAAPARDLYTSQLFKLSRRYAEQSGHPWVILSALWGVVDPERVIEPYDRRMPTRRADREQWGRLAGGELRARAMAEGQPVRYVSLCGEDYTRHLEGLTGYWFRGEWIPNGSAIEYPLEGLGIGQRLSWLSKQTTPATGELFA